MVDVCIVMGVAINDAQNREQHLAVNALKGFGGRILAVVDDLDGDTYRPSMPSLRWCDLHLCFQKKGRDTPKCEVDLVTAIEGG
ncbi:MULTISPECIES: type II toxin-antitoxin system RelE/ParE family toxin [unclassified Mesorhizobium]|uniref:type II toxin-antitoxin system RelE/ParE family toxin n=1 Tax=unclassified Mesorhizobium TaxID=325217 RepID=UPI0019365951|nr:MULTISPECIES: type II toxin-antitoxin system RelE/ParE family toxin [unclassified Mesorhizobium]BCG82950.1 hypothetical protein MesoLj113b_64920 [Mesorhizobium sp. 113-3-3]BCG90828.1 hypothetical protein MesoLj113c_69380 [Mesorhizobium sp. 113-3-9]BCH27042.1 hypothetical protein MesoLjLb_68270 [Mesorhizobium sp. L-8-3]